MTIGGAEAASVLSSSISANPFRRSQASSLELAVRILFFERSRGVLTLAA